MRELLMIVDYGEVNASVDGVFANTASHSYWSSALYVSDPSLAWGVDFHYGDDVHEGIDNTFYVRCVRGEALKMSHFKRMDNIVTDTTTHLQWQDNNSTQTLQKSFQDAVAYCEHLSLGESSDWRLPNITELLSLANKKTSPAVSPAFESTSSLWLYRSSTTDVSSGDFARAVWFKNGGDWIYPKSSLLYARCVRSSKWKISK